MWKNIVRWSQKRIFFENDWIWFLKEFEMIKRCDKSPKIFRQKYCSEVLLLAEKPSGGNQVDGLPPASSFEIFLVIYFILNSLKVHHDTLKYLGMYHLMPFEDWMKLKSMPERLFENLIFVKCWKMQLFFFWKLENEFKVIR